MIDNNNFANVKRAFKYLHARFCFIFVFVYRRVNFLAEGVVL